jgi:hypothetical protein
MTEDDLDAEFPCLLTAEVNVRDLAAIIAEAQPRSTPGAALGPLSYRIRLPPGYPCSASAHDPTPRGLCWG